MMKKKIFTNCFLVKLDNQGNSDKVCLGMKKRGFGKGMWNGAGGKPGEDEPVEKAAEREVQEEFGIKVLKLEKKGEIDFVLKKEGEVVTMHAFLVTEWDGDVVETEEMNPKWFKISKVPYEKMWESDKEWLPIILSGKKIKAKYTYSHEGGKVIIRKINEVESFKDKSVVFLNSFQDFKVLK